MNFWQKLLLKQAISTVVAFLQSTLKNPKSLDIELSVVKEVNQYSAQILVMNGVKPSEGV
jgi:hypothetical protein